MIVPLSSSSSKKIDPAKKKRRFPLTLRLTSKGFGNPILVALLSSANWAGAFTSATFQAWTGGLF